MARGVSALAPRKQETPPGEAGPLLEYTNSTSPTNFSETLPELLDFMDFDEDDFLYGPSHNPLPKKCPSVKGKVTVGRAYPLNDCLPGSSPDRFLYTAHVYNIRCKKRSCSVCSRVNLNDTLKRAFNGELVKEADRLLKAGYKYPIKMFHLTLPGQDFLDSHTPLESLEILRKNQNKLLSALLKRYGKFHFLCVAEPHKSGYPHLHLLLVSENIANEKPLKFVRHLWIEKYHMGFVKVTVKNKGKLIKDARQGIVYATKYMSKGLENFGYNKKLYSCSSGALAPRKDLTLDHGITLFVEMNRENQNSSDLALDQHNRSIDSYELFRTTYRDEFLHFFDTLRPNVLESRLSSDKLLDLKALYPHALLPKPYKHKDRGKDTYTSPSPESNL